MTFLYRFVLLLTVLTLSACGGSTSDNTVHGAKLAPAPADTIVRFLGVRSDYAITKSGDVYLVKNLDTTTVTTVSELNLLKFDDVTVNLAIASKVQKIKSSDLNNLLELYVAFFNRIPDADGLSYWVDQIQNGMTIDQIANSFYQAAIQYSSLTGYSNNMSNADFVRVIYKNVLGRFDYTAPPQADVMYWANSLENRSVSKGQLVRTMLNAAHGFKGHNIWGWVPQLLINKIEVAYYFSVEQGINYNSTEDSIRKGMLIAAAITVSDTETAKTLIGLNRGPAIPDDLWKPPISALPSRGNYVYLQSDRGDYIGGGATYLYTNENAILTLKNDERLINLKVTGNQGWYGNFNAMNSQNKILRGYYSDDLSWSGEGRGCNTLTGWFTIDKIEMTAGVMTALDMRFEQHCEGVTSALRGAIHWVAKDSSSGAAGPINPVPNTLWHPPSGTTPASGNYVYLQSDSSDYIGGGRFYTYTNMNAMIDVRSNANRLSISIGGDQNWSGEFTGMNSINLLQVGYYNNLMGFPFHNPVFGGLSWSGEGRACNTLTGWFAIDKIEMTAGVITALDLRFEQHCEGVTSALRGAIHWVAKDSSSGAIGPINPVPNTLWQAPSGMTPASGNYVYLQSDSGDFIGKGRIYTYTNINAMISIQSNANNLSISIGGDQKWSGQFIAMNSINQLQVGYYNNLKRVPFHNSVFGGLNWSGEGRGCNTLTGWFAIDKISYNAGTIQSLEMRFEQHCEGGGTALRGKIHWNRDDASTAPGPIWPIPDAIWKPLPGMVPTLGNYIYLQSDAGDFIGEGRIYTYTPSNANITISVGTSNIRVRVNVNGNESWNGDFQSMNVLEIWKPGYYPNLQRYPVHNQVKGGMTWSGNGRTCNDLSGWFAIDRITWTAGTVTELDMRFEQHCEDSVSALRGQLHWVR